MKWLKINFIKNSSGDFVSSWEGCVEYEKLMCAGSNNATGRTSNNHMAKSLSTSVKPLVDGACYSHLARQKEKQR